MKAKEEQCELIAVDYLEGEILLSDALLQAYNTGAKARDNETCQWVWEFEDMIYVTACGFQKRIKDACCPHCGRKIILK